MATKDYEQILLDGWEDVFKKSQLTLWLLLALKDGAKHTAAITAFIERQTLETIAVDTQSMYRALRRLADSDVVSFIQEPSNKGPDRKIYQLTAIGGRLLQKFLERNIINVLYQPDIQALVRKEIK